jgi:diguanylate cyclase (GGDEF)-like protein
MSIASRFLLALFHPHTYNLRRNPEAWFGILWGLPVPMFSLLLDSILTGASPREALAARPWHAFFLLHPLLFGVVFGAMGTLRRHLEAERTEFIRKLEALASTDPLTGIHNRRFVLDTLDHSLARAARTSEPLSVVLFDMDRFKAVNDTLGHQAGDRLLKDVASALRSSLRQGDTLGRYGGDEFLLVSASDRASAAALAERARSNVVSKTGYTISAGVATCPADGADAASLIQAADRALGDLKRRRS